MSHDQPTSPWENARRATFERLRAGDATAQDFIIGMQRPMAQQKWITAKLLAISAAISILGRLLAPGSTILAATVAAIILVNAGVANRKLVDWTYIAFCLVLDPPSKTVARMAVRLAAWGFVGDVGAMFFAFALIYPSLT